MNNIFFLIDYGRPFILYRRPRDTNGIWIRTILPFNSLRVDDIVHTAAVKPFGSNVAKNRNVTTR